MALHHHDPLTDHAVIAPIPIADLLKAHKEYLALPEFTDEQLETFFRLLQTQCPSQAPVIESMYEGMVPVSLVLGQQFGDLDFDRRLIQLRRGWDQRGEYPLRFGTEAFRSQGHFGPRQIRMTDRLEQILRDQQLALQALGLPTSPQSWVYVNASTGKPWHPGYLTERLLRPIYFQAGLPRLYQEHLYRVLVKTRLRQLRNAHPHTTGGPHDQP